MAGTRSSARLASGQSNVPPTNTKPAEANGSGRKRKADTSPAQAKKGRKSSEPKKQKTIEETMPDLEVEDKGDDDEKEGNGEKELGNEGVEDKEMADVADVVEKEQAVKDDQNDDGKQDDGPTSATNGMNDPAKDEEPSEEAKEVGEGEPKEADAAKDVTSNTPAPQDEKSTTTAKPAANDELPPEATTSTMDDTGKVEQKEDAKAEADNKTLTNGAVEESKERQDVMPSNILEKGIIYFFTRGRVGVDDPHGVQDIARSYIVLRPLPNGAKIGDGTLEDSKNNRLLALPKKVLPKSGRDQFMTFVEKSGTTIADLKENFMAGSTYDTKTTGVRHTPAVTPIGEGVYAITTTGRQSHLAYMITIPSEVGDVQNDMGLQQKGSFVTSLKNPQAPGPANTNLPQGPDFPKEILDEFRSLRWMPMQPKHLDYEHAQLLLIGEGQSEEGFEKALEPEEKDKKDGGKETPLEEIEKLEQEDHERVEGLKGDEADAVFADLKIGHEDYPKLMTTW